MHRILETKLTRSSRAKATGRNIWINAHDLSLSRICCGRSAGELRRVIIAFYIAAAVIMAVGSLYFAWRNRDFRKFLAGAFFVSSGILFYLYLADVSVPLLGQLLSRHLWPLHRPFHPLLALFLFWASSGTSPLVRQIASRRIVRYNPSRDTRRRKCS
jgi:hypothetical protein